MKLHTKKFCNTKGLKEGIYEVNICYYKGGNFFEDSYHQENKIFHFCNPEKYFQKDPSKILIKVNKNATYVTEYLTGIEIPLIYYNSFNDQSIIFQFDIASSFLNKEKTMMNLSGVFVFNDIAVFPRTRRKSVLLNSNNINLLTLPTLELNKKVADYCHMHENIDEFKEELIAKKENAEILFYECMQEATCKKEEKKVLEKIQKKHYKYNYLKYYNNN